MTEFLTGALLAAVAMLAISLNSYQHKLDALQLQINLVTSRVDNQCQH